jgi:hypothetical protein
MSAGVSPAHHHLVPLSDEVLDGRMQVRESVALHSSGPLDALRAQHLDVEFVVADVAFCDQLVGHGEVAPVVDLLEEATQLRPCSPPPTCSVILLPERRPLGRWAVAALMMPACEAWRIW